MASLGNILRKLDARLPLRHLAGLVRNPHLLANPRGTFNIRFQPDSGPQQTFTLRSSGRRDHVEDVVKSSGGFYEIKMLRDLAQRVATRPGAILDVGANIGNHTLFFAAVLQRDTIAVEPVPENRALLEENLRLNGLSERVNVLPYALGDETGHVALRRQSETNHGTFAVGGEVGDEVTAELHRLDDLARDGVLPATIAFMKIDVEGFERAVLRGAANLIERCQPMLSIECETPARLKEITGLLPTAYRMIAVHNRTPTILFSTDQTAADMGEMCRSAIAAYARSTA